MPKKLTYEKVKQDIENLGYTLLTKEYKNNRTKLAIHDTEGYKYYLYYSNILDIQKSSNRKGLSKFYFTNPFTIQNIKLWCKLNNKPFELINENYKGFHEELKWKCLKNDCGEFFKSTWSSIYNYGSGCRVCNGKQVVLSNCLATKRPDLAKEWHPTLNGDLTPYDVTCGSNKYVWWQCSKNPKHEWKTMVNGRKHCNCPYCNGKLVCDDYNLLTANPKLCEEWDYEKNKNNPNEYLPNSNKQVWWKCNVNTKHCWEATIASRNIGNGCPYCAGQLPSEDYNLLVVNPELCKEWDYIKNKKLPSEYTPNAHQKVWWKCEKGHEWKVTIHNRNSLQRGCPECNQSKGEKRIAEWLDKNLINYEPQKQFKGLKGLGGGNLSYDFFLPQFNILIEYQGEFHDGNGNYFVKQNLKNRQEHDRRKREYAQNHNIYLLEIWYCDFDNIEKILAVKLFGQLDVNEERIKVN